MQRRDSEDLGYGLGLDRDGDLSSSRVKPRQSLGGKSDFSEKSPHEVKRPGLYSQESLSRSRSALFQNHKESHRSRRDFSSSVFDGEMKEEKEHKSRVVEHKSQPVSPALQQNARQIENDLLSALKAGSLVYDEKVVERLTTTRPSSKEAQQLAQIELDRQFAIQLQLEEYENYVSRNRKP